MLPPGKVTKTLDMTTPLNEHKGGFSALYFQAQDQCADSFGHGMICGVVQVSLPLPRTIYRETSASFAEMKNDSTLARCVQGGPTESKEPVH